MAVITPVGSEFEWSPKEKELVKTASTKGQPKSDKDLLYEAAKKVVKAQFLGMEKDLGSPCGGSPCGDVAPSGVEGLGSGDGMGSGDAEMPGDTLPDAAPEATDVAAPAEGGGDVGDVQKAVKDLVDKANKAEEVAAKVSDAVGKVEQAVQEVKDAVGGGVEEIEIEVEDMGGDEAENGDEGGDEGDDDKGGNPFGKEDNGEEEDDKGEKDDIVKESKDKPEKSEKKDKPAKTDKEASKKVLEMKSAAAEDDLARFAALSPSVKKKIYDYWKNDLKYAPDYCKLLVTDS